MGVISAITIFSLWFGSLFLSLEYSEPNPNEIFYYVQILIQAYFYTGLFITAHDAMHRTVHRNRKINDLIGRISSSLYAAMSYSKLKENHFLHHKFPGTEKDPDYYIKSQNFFIWYSAFMIRYLTVWQILIMAVTFNLLKLRYNEFSIWSFWVIPAILSTLQLFYFGTYKPHKLPHTESMSPHNARSQRKNHFFAMLSCYFFGYHHEHHDGPGVPWWQLYRTKSDDAAGKLIGK